jgi:hypothetical protein
METSNLALIILGVIIIGQAVERYFFAKEMTARLGDSIKAVLSRNIGEYIAATDHKPEKREPLPESDEIDITTMNDEQFDAYIKHVEK